MLGHFPPPHDEELLYSVCARYHYRVKSRSVDVPTTLRELFGTNDRVHTQFPRHLEHLVVQLPQEFSITAGRLIDKNTLAPMMQPFLTSQDFARLRADMSGADRSSRRRMVRYPLGEHNKLKYCPFCAQEDRVAVGEAYWHRVHQSSIVQVCVKHECHLSFAKLDPTSRCLLLAEDVVRTGGPVQIVDTRNHHEAVLVWMADKAQWLLQLQPGPPARRKDNI